MASLVHRPESSIILFPSYTVVRKLKKEFGLKMSEQNFVNFLYVNRVCLHLHSVTFVFPRKFPWRM